MKPDFSVATKKLPFFVILIFIVLMIFVFMYPPIATSFTSEYKMGRLLLEGFILYSLSIYLAKSETEILVVLFLVFVLYMMNWFFSTEHIENVLSHFNKFMFLLLISRVLWRRNDLALVGKNIWTMFWVYCSIMGIIGYLLMISNLVSPTLIVGEEVGLGRYSYYHYPLIGNYIMKSIVGIPFPRYTGFLSEPGMLGFFFGFNLVIAKELIVGEKKCRRFTILNMVGGLLTISYAFGIFLAIFLCLRLTMVARLVSKRHYLFGLFCVLGIIGVASAVSPMVNDISGLLPYSSIGERFQQYVLSIDFLMKQSLSGLVFGVGILPFHDAIGGGATAGIFDVLASRGIILLGIWIYVLYVKARHIPGLFLFLMYYSLFIDYWHFPLFMLGLALATSLGVSKFRDRVGSLPANAVSRGAVAPLGGV